MKMTAANENRIQILGALILRISGHATNDNTLQTRQIVYFTDSSDKLYLSRQACVSLGMITAKFPTIGEVQNTCLTNDDMTTEETALSITHGHPSQPPAAVHGASPLHHHQHHSHTQPLMRIARSLKSSSLVIMPRPLSTHANINFYP